jgi:hypothetical protein
MGTVSLAFAIAFHDTAADLCHRVAGTEFVVVKRQFQRANGLALAFQILAHRDFDVAGVLVFSVIRGRGRFPRFRLFSNTGLAGALRPLGRRLLGLLTGLAVLHVHSLNLAAWFFGYMTKGD